MELLGYKQTEIGLIPEDWEVKKLGEICEIIMGQSPLSENYNQNGLGLPLIQGNADIDNRRTIKRNYTSQITKRGKIGDILMSVRAPVGEIAKVTFDCCLGRGVCAIRSENNYLFHYLIYSESDWGRYSTGSTFDSINSNQINEFSIAIPRSIPEQEAIAAALSDADAWVESLEQLIEKKRLLKQAAMQQLLTPKEDWEVKKLGDYVRFQTGFPFSSEYFNKDLRGLRLVKNRDLRSDDSIIYYSGAFSDEFIVNNGDLLVGMDGDFEPVIWKKNKSLLNQRVGRIVSYNKISILYLSFALITILKEIEQSTGSTTVKHLSHSDIENINLKMPSLSEQTCIATILSDMDAEIEALENQWAKAQQIKQGMMQELLTGRIRLV